MTDDQDTSHVDARYTMSEVNVDTHVRFYNRMEWTSED